PDGLTMAPEATTQKPAAPVHAAVEEVFDKREHTALRALLQEQSFWVTIALIVICAVMAHVSEVFFTEDNFFNIARNFSFIGIIALGMTAVIITGGIDLSVGSIVGLSAIVGSLVLNAGYHWWAGICAG